MIKLNYNIIFTNGVSILLLLLLLTNVIDWITGTLKARVLKKENSDVGRKGIVKKIGCWIIVLISFILSIAFQIMGDIAEINVGVSSYVSVFVLVTLIVNEIRSVMENLIECGIKVPEVLVKGLELFNKKVNEEEKK